MIKTALGLSDGLPPVDPGDVWQAAYHVSAFGKAGQSGTIALPNWNGLDRYYTDNQNATPSPKWYKSELGDTWISDQVPRELPYHDLISVEQVEFPIVAVKIDYLEFKDSVSSPFPVIPVQDEERVDITEAQQYVRMRKPKMPSPPRNRVPYPEEPVRRTANSEILPPIVKPVFVDEKSKQHWETKRLPKILEKRKLRLLQLQRIFDNKYDRKYASYVARLALRRAEDNRIFYIHSIRMKRYYSQLQRWQDAIAKAQQMLSRTTRSCHYRQENPYRYCRIVATTDNRGGVPYVVVNRDRAGWPSVVNRGHPVEAMSVSKPLILSAKMHPDFSVDDLVSMTRQSADAENVIGDSMFSSLSITSSDVVEDLTNKVIRKIYDDVGNQQVHIGNMIAESHQTLEMLSLNWRRLAALISLRKGLLRATRMAVKHPKNWANEVLAWKFGAQPLINDLQTGIMNLMINGFGDIDLKRHRTASTGVLDLQLPGLKFSGSVSVSMCVKYHIDNEFVKRINEYGLLDPDQISWEITPWSFVVDWFIPVGEYLQSMTATWGLKLDVVTTKVALAGRWDLSSVHAPELLLSDENNITDTSGEGGPYLGGVTGSYEGVWKHRTLSYEWPDNKRILNFKSPLSWSHGLESIALIVQRLKS